MTAYQKSTFRPAGMSLLLVGCGKMGSALLAGWKKQFPEMAFATIEPAGGTYANLESAPKSFSADVIVFAVKPQVMGEVLPAYRARFGSKPLYMSIAAGKNLAFLATHLGNDARVVRAMPNTPAMIGEGMTVLSASGNLSDADKAVAAGLMEAVGKAEWAEESLMDAVTALSGSGPAYVFLLLEALAKAGVAAGLPAAMALALALQTVTGSALLARGSAESFEQLRKNVTSPGGTTEAALGVLMKDAALSTLFTEAVLAAKKRSKELAS